MLYGVVVKNSPANTRDTGDAALILGAGRSSEVEMATHSSILAWRMPCTEEPGELQSLGLQRVGHNQAEHYSTMEDGSMYNFFESFDYFCTTYIREKNCKEPKFQKFTD